MKDFFFQNSDNKVKNFHGKAILEIQYNMYTAVMDWWHYICHLYGTVCKQYNHFLDWMKYLKKYVRCQYCPHSAAPYPFWVTLAVCFENREIVEFDTVRDSFSSDMKGKKIRKRTSPVKSSAVLAELAEASVQWAEVEVRTNLSAFRKLGCVWA